jgi:hypothetical protein
LQYVNAFKERIQKHRPEIVFEPKRSRGYNEDAGTSGTDTARDPYERHKWMVTMEEFASFLQSAERIADPRFTLKYPVRVAIIDDGVDINEQSVQSKIIGGRSFCHRDEEQNLNQPYYVSSGGHGTAMASLICRICPNVQLYVLKLNEHYVEPGKRQITAKSAARVRPRSNMVPKQSEGSHC